MFHAVNRKYRLELSGADAKNILTLAGFSGYRLDGAAEWILRTMGMIRALSG